MDMELTQADLAELLTLARRALETSVEGGDLQALISDFKPTESMLAISPCFVTLRKSNGDLRGCIGSLTASDPLVENVVWMTRQAAMLDPRFDSVKPSETSDLRIEISVLSAPRDVPSYKDIEVGKHGIVLEKGFHRSVYLPDVASQFGWDRETTLNHLAQKAGLPKGAWREGASFQVFTTLKIRENA